jgi:hypothetical protein
VGVGAGAVIVPILGARRCQQLQDNLGALELALTAEELARLEEVSHLQRGIPREVGADRLAYATGALIDRHHSLGPANQGGTHERGELGDTASGRA